MYDNNNNNNNSNGDDATSCITATKITTTMISPMMRRSPPKDTITIQKIPRRQKSSQYYIYQKVELEKYPNFHGKYYYYYYYFSLDWTEITSINWQDYII